MRIVATFALVLGLFSASFGAKAAEEAVRRGGEGDWPLFCSIPDNDAYDGFLLRAEDRSPSGYTLYFYWNGQAQSAIYPDVQETEDGAYLQVHGVEAYGLFGGRAHHLLAFVAKNVDRNSEAGMKNTLSVVTPTFHSSDLMPSSCSRSN